MSLPILLPRHRHLLRLPHPASIAFRASGLSRMASTSSAAPAMPPAQSSAPADEGERPLVMQIIIDRSILKSTDWSRGALIAQGSHAAIAVIAETLGEPATQEYIDPVRLGSMHKVVLQAPKSGSLADLSARLKAAEQAESEAEAEAAAGSGAKEGSGAVGVGMKFPRHHLWIEQPEGIPTAIAIAPNRKPATLKKLLDKCSLLRD
ncbi:hypothetical protein V8E36_001036 [Tilletia maclaganii]